MDVGGFYDGRAGDEVDAGVPVCKCACKCKCVCDCVYVCVRACECLLLPDPVIALLLIVKLVHT